MYTFSSDKPKRSNNIDGFLNSGPRRPGRSRPVSRPVKQATVTTSSRRGRLDDFHKPDGYHAQSYSQLSSTGATSAAQSMRATSPRHEKSSGVVRSSRLGTKRTSSAKPKRTRKILKRSALLVTVFVLGAGAWFGSQVYLNGRKVFKGGSSSALAVNAETDPYQLKGEGDGRVNVLLMGKGGEAHEGGELTDSIMIASIDPVNNGVTMLSLPRDLWVKPTGYWAMKINAVYSSAKNQALYKNAKDTEAAEQAGINALEKTVEDYMGVTIHYYGMVDFVAFQDAVNAIGGIDVTLAEPYSDMTMRVGKKYLSLPAGTTHLDGATALGYARSRHGAARGDFDRGEHQQIIAVAIKDKVLSLGTFSNPIKVTQLMNTFGNRVRTSFAMDDISRLYELSKLVKSENITHVDLAQESNPVVKTGTVGNQSVVIPVAGVNDYSKVQAFVRASLKDGFLIKENPTVIVLNGTTTVGVAAKKAEELKSYGYNVIQVADAPAKDFTQTQIVDQTKGVKKYTKRYLEQRFGVQSVTSLSSYDLTPYVADFVVIIGQAQ